MYPYSPALGFSFLLVKDIVIDSTCLQISRTVKMGGMRRSSSFCYGLNVCMNASALMNFFFLFCVGNDSPFCAFTRTTFFMKRSFPMVPSLPGQSLW